MGLAEKKIVLFCIVIPAWWGLVPIPSFAALDSPHNAASGYGCSSCHDVSNFDQPKLLPPDPDPHENIDDTQCNSLCWSCHIEGGDAPYVKTHSSLNTSDRYGNWSVECWVCHNQHYQEQSRNYTTASFLYSGVSTGVDETTLTMAGAGWEIDEFKGMLVIPRTARVDINYTITGNTADTLTVNGPIDLGMVTAGDTFAITLGKLIRYRINLDFITDPLDPDAKSGYRTVRFFDREGVNSFADGDMVYDGICEVCHTETKHFRNDGSGDDPAHANLGSVAGQNCMNCHNHENGFAHGGGSGTGCIDCHGHDAGTNYDPDMQVPYSPGSVASEGRGTFQSHSTHTELDSDDLKGPGIYCGTCHNINKFPLFRSVADPNAELSLEDTDVCDECHSLGGSYDGIDDPVIGAKRIWRTGAYVATDDSTLRADKLKWCAGCHDEEPSIIQSVSAPNVVGDEDGSYIYGTGWGYYKTGHGLAATENYPSKGGLKTLSGRPVNCDSCHDAASAHIDGEQRTFNDLGNHQTPSSVYREGYRLKLIGGAEPMMVPWSNTVPNGANKYRLCVQCHDPGPYIDGTNTDTNLYTTDGVQRHYYHLDFSALKWSADWDFASDTSQMTCVSCHNVHGSTRLAMVRDGSLISTPGNDRTPGLEIWYKNDATTLSDPPSPEDVPLSESNGTAWRGNSSSNLCSHCHANNNIVGHDRSVYQTEAPYLEWTGAPGYVSDGVDPDSGVSGVTSFVFNVKYTDLNNDPPTEIEVWIDLDNNGYDDPAEMHAMTAVDAGDTNYADGKLYTYATTLSDTGGNIKKYRFYASDGTDDAGGTPTADSSLYVFSSSVGSGSAPVLDWDGVTTNFIDDGIDPDSGQSGSSFEFRVKYSDAENDPPALIELWIDTDLNKAFSADEKISLTKVGGGTDYVGGEIYNTVRQLYCDGCSIDYRFYASDGSSEATANEPVSISQLVLDNNIPSLAWPGDEPDYSVDGVDPDSGVGGSSFTFRVDYTDADNTAPQIIQVWLDLDNSGTYDNGEKIAMEAVDSDADYTDGKRYTKDITVPYIGDGGDITIKYRFYGEDGVSPATGAPTADNTITVEEPFGNSAPTLDWATADCLQNGVRPPIGAEGADFEFMVTYTDTDNPCPAGANAIQVWIDANDNGIYDPDEKFDLAGDSGDSDCTDGRLYSLTTTLVSAGDGVYTYRFYATDSVEGATGDPALDSTVTVKVALKVRPSGGSGWYSSIQDAVDVSMDPETILVWPDTDFVKATYNENVSLALGSKPAMHNRTIQSVCGPDLTEINAVSPANPAVYIQSAGNCVVDGFSITDATMDYGIELLSTTGTTTIRNCDVFGNAVGVYVNNANPVNIDSCLIHGNTTRGVQTVNGAEQLTISNSEIYENSSAAQGVGIFFNNGTHIITDSVIRNNTSSYAGLAGAGIYFNNGSATLTRTTVSVNFANSGSAVGGGMVITNGADVSLETCTVSGNSTNNTTGAMYILNSTMRAVDSSISGNSCFGAGGAMYVQGSTVSFDKCFMQDNSTTGAGGVMWLNSSTVDVTNAVMSGNQANTGAVININTGVTFRSVNTTFADNTATSLGGVFYLCGSTAASTVVRNSVFWGNVAGDGAGDGNIAFKACGSTNFMTVTDSDTDRDSDAFNASITYSNNITPAEDPLFTIDGTYHIQAGSPVIDQANAAYAPVDDIDGDARPPEPDMGADEYISVGPDGTAVGVATAAAASVTSIRVAMPYSGDSNSNNTYTVEYKLSSEPTVWTPWVVDAAHTASPYTTTITGLATGLDYDIRATYIDADGTSGSAEQTLTGITVPYYILPTGVVAHWKLDEGTGTATADSVGSSDGTLTAGAAWETANAVSGNAVNFAGDVGRRVVPNPEGTGLLNNHAAHSVEAWVYRTADNANRDHIFAEGGSTHGYQLSVFPAAEGDMVHYSIRSSSNLDEVTVAETLIPLNEWTHVVATYDGAAGAMYLYINGQEEGSLLTGVPASIGDPSLGWRIGGSNEADVQNGNTTNLALDSFNGIIDEVIVYDRALSPDEVQERFEGIISITANDSSGGGAGIQGGDQVVILLNAGTNAPAIDASNIDAVLALDNGHSWLDGSGNIGSAVWSTTTTADDTLTVTLSDSSGVPTVAVDDVIVLDGETIRNGGDAPINDFGTVKGSFGP